VTGNVTAARSSEWAQHFSNASCLSNVSVSIAVIIVSEVRSELQSADGDWNHSFDSCLAEVESHQPPSEIFTVRNFHKFYLCVRFFFAPNNFLFRNSFSYV